MACERIGALPTVEAFLAIVMFRKPDGGVRPIGLSWGYTGSGRPFRGWVSKAWERGPVWRLSFWGSCGRGAVDS
eukprot:11223757-Lingulodinium_polyedra.AAC.1